MRPEDAIDGSAHFHRPANRDSSSHGLHLRLRESAGVRTDAAAFGSIRLVALPPGEL